MTDLNSKYHPVPQPDDVSQVEKEDAMGSYMMMFAAFAVGLPLPIINLIAAFVYYILNAKKSRFVKFHCLQSILSQIPTTLMNAVLLGWTLRIFVFNQAYTEFDEITSSTYFGYLIAVAIANFIYFIFSVVGAVRAYKGRFYYFMFFGKVAFHYAYLDKGHDNIKPTNKSPLE